MPSLDVFKADAFSMASLTAAINAMPYQPKMIGEMGLFTPKPIRTTAAYIEKKEGKLSVLPMGARGTMPTVESQDRRAVRILEVPHIPANQTIRADDVQNIRAFGSETELQSVAAVVNEELASLRADHETTFEWQRLGALTGQILDADGTVIYDLFTEFDVTEQTVDFALADETTEVKTKCTEVIRLVEDALGSDTYTDIVALCGNSWWDAFIAHPKVKEAYNNWSAATMLSSQQREGFAFCGITFKNYRGSIGGSNWMADNEGRAFPTGVSQLFQHIMAPGDMMDTVNTMGQAIYAKQELCRFNKGVELHTQSNPLMMCNRPECLIKLTATGVTVYSASAQTTVVPAAEPAAKVAPKSTK